ncbi:unnamed protein product [Symbiodinium necroappetens]|uniref:Uncharacterized protein n=1 Tax=Symbiodinium necroappetens TaxID=1628268 RepID=A0A812ZXD4_9DINO|nr:unnamed protein product [Symbiodinium necroappetens]
MQFQSEVVYAIVGCQPPVLHGDTWVVLMPRIGSAGGLVKLVGHQGHARILSTGGFIDSHRDQPFIKDAASISGVYDITGRFHVLPRPVAAMSIRAWLEQHGQALSRHMWMTVNGSRGSFDEVIQAGESIIVRLRARLLGGGGKSPDFQKLCKHLVQKGVPESAATQRANQIQEAIGEAAIQAAYASLDPWKHLKESAGKKVRLVLPEELRAKSSATKKTSEAKDPWAETDPWSEAIANKQANVEDIQLVPDFFVDGHHQPLPLLKSLTSGAKGVVLASVKDVEVFAQLNGASSDDELAAITLGLIPPKTGKVEPIAITLPVIHGSDKLLVKGFLINLGLQPAMTNNAMPQFMAESHDMSVLTVEARKEYINEQDWRQVIDNPIRYVRSAIKGFQSAVVGSWSRKFFNDRKPASAEDATSFHCFVRVDSESVEPLLAQSGQGGIFMVPKDECGTASGKFRILWLDTVCLERASAMQRANAESCGLTRGKTSLGLRVRPQDYQKVRRRLEPSWDPENIMVDVSVERRWTLAPIPHETSKKSVQLLLNSMHWRATPIKQTGSCAWLVGSEASAEPPADTVQFGDHLVLISEIKNRKPVQQEDAVVAGPKSLRKALGRQLAAGDCVSLCSTVSSLPSGSAPSTVGPTRLLVGELKTEVDDKLEAMRNDFRQAMSELTNQLQASESIASSRAAEIELRQQSQEERLGSVEQSVQSLADKVVTKVDLSTALQAAMEQQTRDLRSLLAKRSPDCTPSSDPKMQKTG